jgi:thioredoxin-related protein
MKTFSKVMGFLLIALMVISFAGCSKEVGVWGTNYEEACKKAESTGTNVLLFFSNLETDPVSNQLNELFATPKFQSKVGKNYQLVNIDIPVTDGVMDYDQMLKNYELASQFAVQALPTVVLATPEGYVIGCVYGNEMFAPITDSTQEVKILEDKVLKDLSAFNKNSKAIVSLRETLSKTEGIDRLALIDKMIGKLDASYRYLLRDLVAEIPELDPENTTGLNTKYKMNFAYEQALEEFQKGNAQRAIEIFVEVAQTEGIPAIDAQEAYQTAAYLAANIGGSDEMVVAYLEKAIEAKPDSDAVAGIQATIDMIKASAEATEATPSTDEVSE